MTENLTQNTKLLQIVINGGLVSITVLVLIGAYSLVANHMNTNTEALIGIKEAVIEIKSAVQASTEQNRRVEDLLRLRY